MVPRALFALLIVTGCRAEQAPSYVRLSGPAPALPGPAASPATLVVFWASWCAPCREETESLRALAGSRPGGLTLRVINVDDSNEAVRAFFRGDPPASWNFTLDPDKRLYAAFGVDKLPAAYLVVGGQRRARFLGLQDWTSRGMRRLLERLISEGPAAG